jgi:predicted LPLAT superfamily acyltransferase/radical SAM superfamily enzyme YgiQ (UPF0313 family)
MAEWEGKTRGGVLGYKIFVWVLKNLGISAAYIVLYPVVFYYVLTAPAADRTLIRFYRDRMGYGLLRATLSIFRNYYKFGQVLLDKVAMLAGFQQQFTFDFEGEEYLRQMEKGGLLVSAHIGNWEIAGQLLNRLEKKIHIILYDAEHERVKGYLSDVLTARRVHFIVIRDDYAHLEEIKNAFAAGDIVAMHGDRYIEGNRTAVIDFLGKPAAFPISPVNLAARFNVPVSFVFAVKETRRHYHFFSTPHHYVEFSTNLKKRDEALKKAVKIFAREMEMIVHRYPMQWFNYYDFWKLPEKPAQGRTQAKVKAKRKLLLVSANRHTKPYPVYPLGLSYLISYIQDRLSDFDIRMFDMNLGTKEELALMVTEYNPDYIGISFRNVDDVDFYSKESFLNGYKEITEMIRNNSKAPLIIGGSAFSIYPEELFGFFQPDYGVSGEGEESLYRLLLSLEKGEPDLSIEGLVYSKGGKVTANRHKEYIKSLDLCFEPRLIDFYWEKAGMLNVQTKRGCPFNCIYCTYPLIEGSKVRTLDVDRIMDTLKDLYFNKKITYIFFTDSVFNISNSFNAELSERMIRAGLKIEWGAYFSPYNLTYDQLELYKRAGLTHIEFGTESLSDRTLKNYGKHFTVDEVVEISAHCNKLNIYFAHFMILCGYGETEETIGESYENSKRIEDSVFFPYVGMRIYPGTKLYDLSVAEGYLDPHEKILEPVYYLAPDIDYSTLKTRADATGRRWVFPDEDVMTAMNRMRKRHRKGSLWHHLKK